MSEELGKSSNPAMNTALETISAEAAGAAPRTPEPVYTIATGHEGTVGDQVRATVQRIRGGEMGMLPALAGLLVLGILFSVLSEFFLTKGNIANLMTQTAELMMLAIALTFVIILTEIDLSAGVTGGVGMATFIILVNDKHWNWILALRRLFAGRRGDRQPSSATSWRRSASRRSSSRSACSSASRACC